jgi:xanthine/CO dehydrogenase XdhC/CoxF family maturation factor
MATPEHIDTDAACAVAHGAESPPTEQRTLIAVFASPVAEYLLRYGQDLGYRPVLLEPDPDRPTDPGVTVVTTIDAAKPDNGTDVVVTDHHRDELGPMLRDALASPVRWIGLMGNPRHAGPHHAALAALGVPDDEIARVHRPIGLNIGSRTPPEIAIATLAGLLADRNNRPGGLTF